jgi:hypothetical protein
MSQRVEQAELARFAAQLNAEVRDRAEAAGVGSGRAFTESTFADLVCENLVSIGVLEEANIAFFEGRVGRAGVRVNGYGMSDSADTLDLIAALFLNSAAVETVGKEEIVKAAVQARRFLTAAVGNELEMERPSDEWDMASRISSAATTLRRCRILLVTDGRAAVRKIEAGSVGAIGIEFDIWDIERLYRALPAGMERSEIEIDFEREYGGSLPCLELPSPANEYSAYSASIPGEVLCRLYEKYGARLLELNVRSFLSARGKVNSGIRKTLREEPTRFLAYNNGIVATVDEISAMRRKDGQLVIKSVKGLQIVNGGQTTASIHRAKFVDRIDVSSVFVPAKITLIDPSRQDEIVRNISRCANTQNVSQIADLSANDSFHIEIERLSENIWNPGEGGRWFYERARGQYQVAKARRAATPSLLRRFNTETPPARKFTKTDLAKFMQAWSQHPHQVSLGAQKNFDHFMHDLREHAGRDWVPDGGFYKELVAKAIVFRTAERIVREEGFPAYRANIIAYLVAYLSYVSAERLDLEAVWQRQELSESLRNLLRAWSHAIAQAISDGAQGRNVTEWCKKVTCWEMVRLIELRIDGELPPELGNVAATRDSPRTPMPIASNAVYLSSVDRCKRVDGETWLKIAAWGAKSSRLKEWESGISHTLAGYAAAGWKRSPSPKQAKHAIRILELAAEDGVVPASKLPPTQ